MRRLLNVMLSRLALGTPGGYSVRPSIHRLRGVKIGEDVWISQGVYIDELYPEAITIHANCTIGFRTSIFAHFHWGPRRANAGYKPVIIGDNVFIGPNCVVLPGVRIGAGSVIRAGSVVSRNIPPRIFWGGAGGRAIARITVPLGADSPYENFVNGLKPISSTSRRSAVGSRQRDIGIRERSLGTGQNPQYVAEGDHLIGEIEPSEADLMKAASEKRLEEML